MATETHATTIRWDWTGHIHRYVMSELARGRRIGGVESYAMWLRHLAGYADGRAPTADLIASFIEHKMSGGTIATPTLAFGISAITSFATWLRKRGILDEDIMAYTARPRVPRRDVISAPREQIARVARWMEDSEAAPLRSRLFCALCLYAGLRFTEARLLEWRDVDELAGELVVRPEAGKGGRSRRVPIAPPLARILGETPRDLRSGPVVTRLEDAQPLSRGGAEQIFNRELRRAGITLTAHMLRRAFATRIDELGHSLRVIQELLGHSSLATTERYIGVDRARKKAAAAALDGAFTFEEAAL